MICLDFVLVGTYILNQPQKSGFLILIFIICGMDLNILARNSEVESALSVVETKPVP